MNIYGLLYIINFYILKKKIENNLYKFNLEKNKFYINRLLYVCFFISTVFSRIGYILIYRYKYFVIDPLILLKIWHGGMSFYCGVIGVFISLIVYSYFNNLDVFKISDIISYNIPLCVCLGRLSNFINGELWGRVNISLPWSMIFNNSIRDDLLFLKNNDKYLFFFLKFKGLPRHPSQIYEFFLEGVVINFILKFIKKKNISCGIITGLFMFFYSIFRFYIEFFRHPEIEILINNIKITIDQLLSIFMLIFSLFILIYSSIFNYKYEFKLVNFFLEK